MKIVKIDEFRCAKNAYRMIKNEDPQFKMSFWGYFIYMKQKKEQWLEERRKNSELNPRP